MFGSAIVIEQTEWGPRCKRKVQLPNPVEYWTYGCDHSIKDYIETLQKYVDEHKDKDIFMRFDYDSNDGTVTAQLFWMRPDTDEELKKAWELKQRHNKIQEQQKLERRKELYETLKKEFEG